MGLILGLISVGTGVSHIVDFSKDKKISHVILAVVYLILSVGCIYTI